MVLCKFMLAVQLGLRQACFYRTDGLPFFPRKGDRFVLFSDGVVYSVDKSTYDLVTSSAGVVLSPITFEEFDHHGAVYLLEKLRAKNWRVEALDTWPLLSEVKRLQFEAEVDESSAVG